jgi:hypothetical protein
VFAATGAILCVFRDQVTTHPFHRLT